MQYAEWLPLYTVCLSEIRTGQLGYLFEWRRGSNPDRPDARWGRMEKLHNKSGRMRNCSKVLPEIADTNSEEFKIEKIYVRRTAYAY